MKNYLITAIAVLSISLNALSQNVIYKGDQQYPATNSWNFKCESYFGDGGLDVQIAKTVNGGYLMLSINVPATSFFIGGPVYLFLTDGSIVTCTDKGIKDNVDKKSIVLYVFNHAEMDKLKILDIQKIRFSVKQDMGPYGESIENYTATNKRDSYRYSIQGGSKEKDYYETSRAVALLLEGIK